MGKSKTTRTSSDQSFGGRTDVDFASQEYRDYLRGIGRQGVETVLDPRNQFTAGPHAAQQSALDRLRGLPNVQAQGLGFAPSQMDPSRAAAFFNPYNEAVIGSVQQNFDRQRQQAMQAAQDHATRAGAFGGSRQAVLEANALRDVNQNEAATIAGLQQQGFRDAQGLAAGEYDTMQRLGFGAGQADQQAALQAALANQNAGLQSANQEFNFGSVLQSLQQRAAQDPIMRQQLALALAQGAMGPVGQVSSGFQRGTTTNKESGGLLGGIVQGITGLGGIAGGLGLFGGGGSAVPAAPAQIAMPAPPTIAPVNFGVGFNPWGTGGLG